MSEFWYCLKHHRVEPTEGEPNKDRLGPYATEAEASRALEKVQERNEAWDGDEKDEEEGELTLATRRRRRSDAASPWPFVGMGGLATTFFLYAASGLVAPWWAVVVLLGVWAAMLALAIRWWTPHPTWLVWLAALSAVLWFAVLVGGARFLGWS